MQLLLSEPKTGELVSFWKNPSAWLRQNNLGRAFWVFFTAAFFFDAGFSVYFFLFNLYLLDLRFNERVMGLVGGAMMLGSVVGTLPAGMLTRKIGVRPLLVFLFITAPLMGVLRAIWVWEPAQIGLAFVAGLAMSCWGVCFLPAVARLTTDKNRASAFSLIFSVSIGTSALGGMICGYLPHLLNIAGFAMQTAEVKRLILVASCGVAALGLVAVLGLQLPKQELAESPPGRRGQFQRRKLAPFLWRFLPVMALWSAVLASFTPFANVYLSRDLHIPLARIGIIFSAAQVVQLCMGLLTPLIVRAVGLVNGIVGTQMAATLALAFLAMASNTTVAVALFLSFSAAQWMSSPGLYNLLMNETPDGERSSAAAMTLFCNALAGAAATAIAGILFTRFGYPRVLIGISALALTAAALFWFLISPRGVRARAQVVDAKHTLLNAQTGERP
jgi:MFS family permease